MNKLITKEMKLILLLGVAFLAGIVVTLSVQAGWQGYTGALDAAYEQGITDGALDGNSYLEAKDTVKHFHRK